MCGFGRVGQNLARVLEQQGFEYIALDMDTRRVQAARQAGDPVIFGDGAQTEILEAVGLEHCSVLVLTFADPDVSLRIVARCARCVPTCRCSCARRTIPSSKRCRRRERRKSCRKRWKRA